MQPNDPSQMRISDSDRHRVADLLRDAAGEGRLDLEELEERLEAAYSAKVYADLVPLTLDLPGPSAAAPLPHPGQLAGIGSQYSSQPVVGAPTHQSSVAFLSGIKRAGYWEVPETHSATAVMGSVEIDLREARFVAPVTVITANAVMGEVTVYVNAHTHVIVEGAGVMGDYSQTRDRVPATLGPDSPIVRIKGIALMGAVTVTRKRMPGEPGKLKKMLGG